MWIWDESVNTGKVKSKRKRDSDGAQLLSESACSGHAVRIGEGGGKSHKNRIF